MEMAVGVKDLAKIYNGKTKALDGVDLEVEAGKVFALLGPNGAGKTTLIRILTTQLKPSAGGASVFGLDVSRQGAQVRRLISHVPQEMSVWTDISGYENLLIYAKIFGIPSQGRRESIDEAMKSMGLDEFADDLVKIYSGGMIRRLEIACAMLIKPRIMFLDEPTIGLDPSAKKAVWERLTSFKKEYGVTVFFNTHYMDEADLYSDEIAIINRGKIVTKGTAEELKRSLGGEALSFFLVDAPSAENFTEKIRATGLVKTASVSNSELSVLAEDAEAVLPRIIEILRKEGVPVERISVTKPTLDDVFLKYAGTRLEVTGRISDVKSVRYRIRRG